MSYAKTVRDLKIQHQRMLNTFVREKWGEIPNELEVKLKSLKAWGFDLLMGLKGGESHMFVADEDDKRKKGDIYEEHGEKLEVKEVVSKLPKGSKIIINVELEDRRGIIKAYYRPQLGQEDLLFSLPSAELLLVYFKKRGFNNLLKAFQSSGLTTEFIQKNGEQGKAYDYEELPPQMKRALREAWDLIRKKTKVGRFTLAYFGQNKDKKDRYIASWILPTIYLFDVEVAESLNKLLQFLDK